MPLLPQECPNCGRLHPTADFHTEPGPVQRELASAMEGIERVIRCWDELDLTPLRSGVEDSLPGWFNQAMEDLRDLTPFELRSVPAVAVAPRASASELEGEVEIERPDSAPRLGHVPAYDAGWCGYNKDAPGDIIHRVASMRAREVLQAAGMLEYEEERHLIWCASRSWFGERRGKCDCSSAEQASVPAVDVPRASAAELEEEPKVERPAAAPLLGQIPSYDAGWNAHEVGLDRKTVEVLSPDPGWALLGWDMRALLAKRQKEESA